MKKEMKNRKMEIRAAAADYRAMCLNADAAILAFKKLLPPCGRTEKRLMRARLKLAASVPLVLDSARRSLREL